MGEFNKVYSKLVEDHTDIVGLIAYGLYKSDKRQCIIDHKSKNGDKNPTKDQMTKIENLLSVRLDYYQDKANQLLDTTVEQLITLNKDNIYINYFKSEEFEKLENKITELEKNTKPKSFWSELLIEISGNVAWLIIVIIITVFAYFLNDDVKKLKEKAVDFINVETTIPENKKPNG